jgi:hypothetical protein
VATRERAAPGSGTPRKERPRESSAVQDPGLKDYVRTPARERKPRWPEPVEARDIEWLTRYRCSSV